MVAVEVAQMSALEEAVEAVVQQEINSPGKDRCRAPGGEEEAEAEADV